MDYPEKMTPEQVKAARETLGLSLNQMAIRLGITERRYWDWENTRRGASAIGTRLILRMLEDHAKDAVAADYAAQTKKGKAPKK